MKSDKAPPSGTYSIRVRNARRVGPRMCWPGVYAIPRDLDESTARTLLVARVAEKVLPEIETK